LSTLFYNDIFAKQFIFFTCKIVMLRCMTLTVAICSLASDNRDLFDY